MILVQKSLTIENYSIVKNKPRKSKSIGFFILINHFSVYYHRIQQLQTRIFGRILNYFVYIFTYTYIYIYINYTNITVIMYIQETPEFLSSHITINICRL